MHLSWFCISYDSNFITLLNVVTKSIFTYATLFQLFCVNLFFSYLSHVFCLLMQWEKQCKQLKRDDASSSEGSHRPLFGPPNDIHNELNFEVNNFDKNVVHSLESNLSNGVMPLQYHTNEKYQLSHSVLPGVPRICSPLHDAASFLPVETHLCKDLWNLKDLTGSCNLLYLPSSKINLFRYYGGGSLSNKNTNIHLVLVF